MRGTSFSRLLSFAAIFAGLAGAVLPAASVAAQNRIQNSIPDRIAAALSSSRMVEIPGSVHPRALQATDLGPLPGDTRLSGMSLRFTPSAAQQAALDQFLVDLQDPSSPRYHQWLTPPQYAAQFGLSSADLARVTAWLASQGFSVTGVAQGGSFIPFDGTVAQIQTAFATSIHSLSLNGETHFANVTGVSVPSAFAGVVGGVAGLHDFRMKPHLHTSIVKPQFTSSVSGNHYLTPGDIYTIYDVSPLLANSINGANQIIAVSGQVDISLTDVAAFRAAAGLSANAPTVQVVPTAVYGGCDPGTPTSYNRVCVGSNPPTADDLGESSLDVEWSGAMAPSASVLFVTSQNVFISMEFAIDANVAPIVTTSYGLCEAGISSLDRNSFNQLFQQANVQGQTILAAAGDSGATDCDLKTATSAIAGLAVDFPASSPYVTALGGTQFNGDAEATGSGTTWGATQYWKGTSGSDVISSALSYIPEAAWNETAAAAAAGAPGLTGGGGGASAYFAKPSWQVETGASGMITTVPTDVWRDVPDIALDAAIYHDTLLFCVSGSCGNGFRIASGIDAGGLTGGGGTSFDSQIFGGMLALVEQKIGSRIGNANPTLYALGNKTAYYNTTSSSVFHDVTTGTNAMPCTKGTTGCPNGGSIGYSAGTGYDLATGWGSVDLYNLANAWNVVAPVIPGFTINSNASLVSGVPTISVAAGGTIPSVTITVTPVNGFTGAVTFTGSVYVNSGDSAGVTPTIAFSPASVTISSTSSASTTLTLSGITASLRLPNAPGTLDPATMLARQNSRRTPPWTVAGSGVSLACLLLLVLPRRRRLGGLLLLAFSVALIGGATGCGSSQSAPPTTTTTTSPYVGTYLVTVTGTYTGSTSGILPQNTTVTYLIQ